MKETRDWIGVTMASGLGAVGVRKLLDVFGSPSAILDVAERGKLGDVGLSKTQMTGLSDIPELRRRADVELEKLMRYGGETVSWQDDDYPALLRETFSPPLVLYVHGDRSLLNSTAVAMVGSRAATRYGRRAAFSIAGDLAGKGVTVISGLAAGIDAEAHTGCLHCRGKTIGVLGCGLDVVYPRSNRQLYSRIVKEGLLVTEYPLGTKPEGFRFPARNRIIAGISCGVVVVEAAKKSGSLITVQFALDEGREVFAVPGQIDSAKSGGTHWLLQQGASLIVSADDVTDALGLASGGPGHVVAEAAGELKLDPASLKLLSYIDSYPIQRDELIRISGMAPAQLSEQLLLLELEGIVELMPGDEVCRVSRGKQ